MKRRSGLFVLLAALMAALATPISGSSTTPISKLDWEPNQKLGFDWRDDAVPPAWMRSAVLSAAADSNASRGARAAVLAHDSAGRSWFAYTAQIDHPAAIAYASRRVPDLFRIWLRPHGYVFDWGKLRWCQFFDTPPDGCFDARMVGLHEIGHVQGLGHIEDAPNPGPWLNSIMHEVSRAKPKTGWNVHQYGPCDVAALQIRYQLLKPSTRVSSCLSLATTLTFSSSSSSVPAGSSVTFTATLRLADDIAYPRLASDPLSNRTVVLQRRAPNGTSWTTHATMPAASTAGSYRLTIVPSATYVWRALLSQPAEGVQASSSPILKVLVGCNPYCYE